MARRVFRPSCKLDTCEKKNRKKNLVEKANRSPRAQRLLAGGSLCQAGRARTASPSRCSAIGWGHQQGGGVKGTS